MENLFKIPLVFFFIASCIGLFLRYQMIEAVDGVVYSYMLHTHSHVMFLGWVFNVLIIAFAIEFKEIRSFKMLFWFLQFCVLGMLASFPLQGYGAFSITFSTLHTFAVLFFVIEFFRSTKNKSTIALTLAKASLLFFALSSFGPFFLGYLKANALDHLDLYRNSIYFYLHFQYNGFFLFGVLSLFLTLVEGRLPEKDKRRVAQGSYILIACCIPVYSLSILWAHPGMIFNVIGFLSAVTQLVGLWFFIQPLTNPFINVRFIRLERLLLMLSVVALVLKSILQLISALPSVAVFVNEFRSIVIAYLHLVLLGCISFFLIAWLIRKKVTGSGISIPVWLIIAGFIGSQIMLSMAPWNDLIFQVPIQVSGYLMFLFSISMVCGIGMIVRSSFSAKD